MNIWIKRILFRVDGHSRPHQTINCLLIENIYNMYKSTINKNRESKCFALNSAFPDDLIVSGRYLIKFGAVNNRILAIEIWKSTQISAGQIVRFELGAAYPLFPQYRIGLIDIIRNGVQIVWFLPKSRRIVEFAIDHLYGILVCRWWLTIGGGKRQIVVDQTQVEHTQYVRVAAFGMRAKLSGVEMLRRRVVRLGRRRVAEWGVVVVVVVALVVSIVGGAAPRTPLPLLAAHHARVGACLEAFERDQNKYEQDGHHQQECEHIDEPCVALKLHTKKF